MTIKTYFFQSTNPINIYINDKDFFDIKCKRWALKNLFSRQLNSFPLKGKLKKVITLYNLLILVSCALN